MKMKLMFVLSIAFALFTSASAQNNRMVTNEDLEKYRQKRLAAERDYRENYEKMGFPSPEELERQIEQSRAERSRLSARLEAEKLQRDQLNLERERAEAQSRNLQYQTPLNQTYQNDYFSNAVYPNFNYGGFLTFPNFGGAYYNRGNRGGFYGNFGNNRRGNFNNQPRLEYRNNLPVIVPPAPQRIFAPSGGGRRN